jgi:hypothetical protein
MIEQNKDRTNVVNTPGVPAEEPVTRPATQANMPTAQKELSTADMVASEGRVPGMTPKTADDSKPMALLAADEAGTFRTRWSEIQAGFVDEPSRAVQQGDALVAELMKRLAQIFADERTKLEGQSKRGEKLSTEDMRVALQRYRSFFNRLLSV